MYEIADKQFCYLAHPRTASVATRDVLVGKFGAEMVGSHHTGLTVPKPTGWTVVTTVRNPLDVMISWWHKTSRNHKLSLYEFIRMWSRNTHFLPDGRLFWHSLYATHVLRYEANLEAQLNQVLVGIGLVPVTLPAKDCTGLHGPAHYMEFYKHEARAHKLVHDHFGQETEELGYL